MKTMVHRIHSRSRKLYHDQQPADMVFSKLMLDLQMAKGVAKHGQRGKQRVNAHRFEQKVWCYLMEYLTTMESSVYTPTGQFVRDDRRD
jgi:hypothetical protein